jgi:prepilin-type processing-associated H-X9-DG protein
MSNLRQLGMGIMLYQTEHKGAYPDDLKQTAPYFKGKPSFDQTMVNPLHPERKPGYIYVKPWGGPRDIRASDTAVAYESFDQWPGQVAVLFADGHVEGISDQHRFEHLLDEAKNPKHK